MGRKGVKEVKKVEKGMGRKGLRRWSVWGGAFVRGD